MSNIRDRVTEAFHLRINRVPFALVIVQLSRNVANLMPDDGIGLGGCRVLTQLEAMHIKS
jgi:hypothetical protein